MKSEVGNTYLIWQMSDLLCFLFRIMIFSGMRAVYSLAPLLCRITNTAIFLLFHILHHGRGWCFRSSQINNRLFCVFERNLCE